MCRDNGYICRFTADGEPQHEDMSPVAGCIPSTSAQWPILVPRSGRGAANQVRDLQTSTGSHEQIHIPAC